MADEKPNGNWLWNLLRRKSRRELDRLERDLIVGRFERRTYAGDPEQPESLRVKTRNR